MYILIFSDDWKTERGRRQHDAGKAFPRTEQSEKKEEMTKKEAGNVARQ
jgi:hypothetical protein